jgi:hypothetical protein
MKNRTFAQVASDMEWAVSNTPMETATLGPGNTVLPLSRVCVYVRVFSPAAVA